MTTATPGAATIAASLALPILVIALMAVAAKRAPEGLGHSHDASEGGHSHGAVAQKFTCPMRCDDDKEYASAGLCPSCGMALQALGQPHADHTPRHGGILYMAPDGFHHIEGALADAQELRLYPYDDYTRPIQAEDFTGRVSASAGPTAEGAQLSPLGQLEPVAGADYLSLLLPEGTRAPLSVRMEIEFPERDGADVFKFEFDGKGQE